MSNFTYSPQNEVLSAADGVRRRYWSDGDKLRIVQESFVGHRQAAATARRNGICRSLLTTWRRLIVPVGVDTGALTRILSAVDEQ
ncbi:MAG: transposase [Roseibium sp.]